MILSYNWLKEMVDIPVGPQDLVEILTFLGMEVEKSVTLQSSLGKVVIGEIIECAHIEGTDHLSITKVNTGGEHLSIVCGAPNARQGLKVVVMLPGATTADGHVIKKAKLRGYESIGMLASEVELGLSEDHSGIIEGDANWQIGVDAACYLDTGDTIYDVEITPNRPDFLSHVGVARDLAAKFKLQWHWPQYSVSESEVSASSRVSVEIKAPQACPRYAARVITGVKVAPSDFKTRLRLTRCGLRPISNVVDVTNYLMLEFGQPLHAFDERFVEGNKIVVRYADKAEKFVTLDGKDYQLKETDLLIADARKGIALAGVMGGLNSEIREDTGNVIIECAHFDSVHVRRTAKSLGMSTDSSRRFERGMDPNGVRRVIDAAACMMNRLAGGQILAGCVDNYPATVAPLQINYRPSRSYHVIGLDVEKSEQKAILEHLGCEVSASGETWTVIAPTFRPDLEREIDLIEEIIRVHGYNEIPCAVSSRVPLECDLDPMWQFRRRVVDGMVSLGFYETLSVSMYTPDERRDPPNMPKGVPLANPVTDDMKLLHGSIFPQMLRAAAANWQRGDRDLRLFEVAKVFHEGKADDPRTWERLMLYGLITGHMYPQGWAHPSKLSDFYDLKGIIDVLSTKISLDKVEFFCYDTDSSEHVAGELRSQGKTFGKWGVWPSAVMGTKDIDAPVAWFELDLEAAAKLRTTEFTFVPLPRFPTAWRDIAVVIDCGIEVGTLIATIQRCGGKHLTMTEPFDVFQSEKLGKDKKSVAIRVEFSHPDRSLEADEVDRWMNDIVKGLEVEHGATLR